MGKRILVQRKGRGSSVFRSPSHKKIGEAKYPFVLLEEGKALKGIIRDILHDPGRGAPLALVRLENNIEFFMVAPEGVYVGQEITYGYSESPSIGDILPLSMIPDGAQICNIEGLPGDGGKYARASGAYATLVTHSGDTVFVQLPSGKQKMFNGRCRATIGVVAGGGRTEKPFVKAGKVYHLSTVKAWKWPVVRGVAMNPVSHPHGGGSHQSPGKPTTVSRNAPPGAKVGLIAARRTGHRGK